MIRTPARILHCCKYGKQNLGMCALGLRSMSVATQPKQANAPKPKTGILMLNMGGPTKTDQVHDFLLRILTDRDMIQMPMQSILGPWIAKQRTPDVQKKYEEIGGSSPILKLTNIQGELLCKQLDKISPETAPHKHYVAFRYAHPLTGETLQELEKDEVEHVVVFSQYPQYSCATSGSSFIDIRKYYKNRPVPKNMKWSVIDRWPTHPLLVKCFVERIKDELARFPANIRDDVIILFSAHSLPLQSVTRGDSYPPEIGATVQAVIQELNCTNPYMLAWQSKVGPLPWLGPFTDEALKQYVQQGKKNFILVPIAFVNDHIETLHELDIEYCQDLAKEIGIQKIRRAAAPNDHPIFIDALTDIVASHLKSEQSISSKFLMLCPHCVNDNCLDTKNWFSQICKT